MPRDAVTVTVLGLQVRLASLEDVIRCKEAANRDKDHVTLPALRKLAEMLRARK